MTSLPAHLKALEADISLAAGRRVKQLRRRRRAAQAAAVLVLCFVMAGAGLAASGVGIFGWLAGGDQTQARFSVDPDATYAGLSPQVIGCSDVSEDTFLCAEQTKDAERVYEFLYKTTPPPFSSREDLLDQLAAAEQTGRIDAELAADLRGQVDAVSGDFFAKLALLSQLQSVAGSVSDERGEIVPPQGVPGFVVCVRADGTSLQCKSLRGAENVPTGSPIYRLRVTSDWRVREGESDYAAGNEYNALFLQVLDRPLTPEEIGLLVTLTTVTESGGRVEEPAPTLAEPAQTVIAP